MKPEDKRAFMAWYLDFGFAGDSSQQEKVWQAACAHRDAQPAVAVNESLINAAKLALDALEVLTFGAKCDPHYSVAIVKLRAAIAASEAAKGGV